MHDIGKVCIADSVLDGRVGLGSRNASAHFDSFSVKKSTTLTYTVKSITGISPIRVTAVRISAISIQPIAVV